MMHLTVWSHIIAVAAWHCIGIPKEVTAFTFPMDKHNSFGRFVKESTSQVVLKGGYNSDPGRGSFWNRETSTPNDFSGKIVNEARILSLSDPGDKNNEPLQKLPEGARLLAVGTCLDDFDIPTLRAEEPNVVFVSHKLARKPLEQLLEVFPSIEWIHARSAGIDFVTSPGLAAAENVILTNAKGMFSSTLAEYCMMACSYFAKDLPRLMRQKGEKSWDTYDVLELRGSTMGIVGYGDIGRACAKLANAYGMKVIALRQNPKRSMYDPYCDQVYGMDQLGTLMSQSDYILVATPLTDQTKGMINELALMHAKKDAVLINVGRGPVVDEGALVGALASRKLKGAALDVTTVEPLPPESALWSLDNVLLSPHNMDQTATFMKESTTFFVEENLPRFIRDVELLNPTDKAAGY